jgi:hypothetical protein
VNNTRGLNNLYKNFRNSKTRQFFRQGVTLTPNKKKEIINKLVTDVNSRIINFPQNRQIKLRYYLSKRKNINKITNINNLILNFKKFETQKPFFAKKEPLLNKTPRAMWQRGVTQVQLQNKFTGVVPLTKAKLIKNQYPNVNLRNLTTFLSSKNQTYLLGKPVSDTYKAYMNEKKINTNQ